MDHPEKFDELDQHERIRQREITEGEPERPSARQSSDGPSLEGIDVTKKRLVASFESGELAQLEANRARDAAEAARQEGGSQERPLDMKELLEKKRSQPDKA